MPRIRKIRKNPPRNERNYFVVDACFLAEKYLQIGAAKSGEEEEQRRIVHLWWKEIDRQVANERARVYVPDLCIAEAFKVLAKKYYREDGFKSAAAYKRARDRLAKDVSTEKKVLKAKKRYIRYHDMPATRDIVIAVDRFYELFLKHGMNVSIVDLIVVASAKYLMDFYDLPKRQMHIITMDHDLWAGTRKIAELPNAYDPWERKDSFERVFT